MKGINRHFYGICIIGLLAACSAKSTVSAAAGKQSSPAEPKTVQAADTTAPQQKTPSMSQKASELKASSDQQARGTGVVAAKKKAPSVDKNSPRGVIENYTMELRKISEIEKKKRKKVDSAREEKIAGKVREFFDFRALAEKSLGKHWSKVTRKERKDYTSLFIELVESSYLRRSRDLVGNYNLEFGKEKISKDKVAKVPCTVIRDDANVDIVYHLHRMKDHWMIFNIEFDSVDLIQNYRAQFGRIIQQKSMDHLLSLMRRKLEVADQEDVAL